MEVPVDAVLPETDAVTVSAKVMLVAEAHVAVLAIVKTILVLTAIVLGPNLKTGLFKFVITSDVKLTPGELAATSSTNEPGT